MRILKNIYRIILAKLYSLYNYIVGDIFLRDDLMACVPCSMWKLSNWTYKFKGNIYIKK